MLLFLAALPFAGCAQKSEMKISKSGKALVPIVLSDNPTRCETYAANELAEHLKKICGGDFKIIKLSEASGADGAIYVGNSPKTRELLPDFDPKTAAFDSVAVETVGKNLVLTGHAKRGTLYAVYTFLEDNIGVRWWADDGTFIPENPDIKIGAIKTRYAPPLTYRRIDYRVGFDPVLSGRLKSGILLMKDAELRKEIDDTFAIWCHSFYKIIPPEKYFKEHPEWFSMINGRRTFKDAQLCLSNEDMTKEAVKNVLEALRKKPHARFVHVSQNDWINPCDCPKCKAFEAAHGGERSASVINFANKIGEAIEKEFPDVSVVTFAYQYTRSAPKSIKPRKNVWVELCSIECDFAHPLETDKDFGFTKDILDWSKLTKNLTIWDYVTCFKNYAIPYPNFGVLAPNVRFFAKNGAVGLFEQSDQTNVAGDFVRFRLWYLSHLLWNPALDEKKLAKEFFDGYYAPEVGGFLGEYVDTISARAEKVRFAQRCYFTDTPTWMDYGTYAKLSSLMERANETAAALKAQAPAKYSNLADKIRREKISIDYVGVRWYAQLFKMAKKEGASLTHPRDPEAAAKDIVARWAEFKTDRINQHEKREDFLRFCKDIVESARNQAEYVRACPDYFEPKDLAKKFKEGTFIDIQEERIDQSNPMRGVTSRPPRLVAEKTASNGFAAKLDADSELHRRFEVPLRADLAKLESASGAKNSRKFRIYAALRSDSPHPKGAEIVAHIFDAQNSKIVAQNKVAADMAGKDYKFVDLGAFEIESFDENRKDSANLLLWIRLLGTKNPGDAYADRIAIVRE